VSIEGNQATEALPAEFAAATALAILIAALFWKERGLALGFYAPLLSTLEFLNGHIRRRELFWRCAALFDDKAAYRCAYIMMRLVRLILAADRLVAQLLLVDTPRGLKSHGRSVL
jgi:hypothetical protein